jgi:hypothetical protein
MSNTKNQIVFDLPFTEYKKNPGVNASFLKKFSVSPLFASTDEFESSAATDLGNYVHSLLIDKGTLGNYACLPTTGEGSKNARAQWRKDNPNGILLSPSAMEQGKATAESLSRYPYYQELLDQGDVKNEVTLFCKHPRYGFPMKARIDILVQKKDKMWLGDIKTFGNPLTKKALFWGIRDRGYDIQLAHYRRCLQIVLNASPEEMALYFVETETAAHDACKVTLDEGWLAHAEHRLDEYYRIYNDCYESEVFPGFNFGKPLNLTLGETI